MIFFVSQVNMKGEWFNGQSLQLKGTYQDRTSNVKKFYHLKLNVQSKSFNDINFMVKFSHDHHELKFHLHTEMKGKIYALKLKNSDITPYETKSSAEVNWENQVYSLTAHTLTENIKKTTIEVHLDK